MERQLSPVQEIIWNIFRYIYDYLESEKIDYYMLGGTLLGAVRHKGFIPWDDDIDIGIPRSQYEKFLNGIGDALPEWMAVEDFRTDPQYDRYVTRIVDTRHSLKRTGTIKKQSEYIWVDVFPLDGMPDNCIIRRLHMWRIIIAEALYYISRFDKVTLNRSTRTFAEKMIVKLVKVTGIGKGLSTTKRMRALDRILKIYPYETSKLIVNALGEYKFKEMFPKEWYGKGKPYQFEDLMLMGPENYDAVLKQMYGDYMTPPKDEDKNVHQSEMIE